MKAAIYHGPGDITVGEVADPRLEQGDILLRVKACGICGSDLHTYLHGMFEDLGAPVESGRVLGHELSGEIAEINGEAAGFKVGDRVCTVGAAGNAEFMRVPALMTPILCHIPEGISFEEAATTEPLATSMHGVNLAGPREGETHIIMGAGIIGLGVLQVLKATARVRTMVVDVSDRRLNLAREFGADLAVNAAREDSFRKALEFAGEEQVTHIPDVTGKADVVYDCAGLPRNFTGTPALEQAVSLVRQNGRVVVIAAFEKPVQLDPNIVMRKGITIFGSWAWTVPEFRRSLELIGSGRIDRKPLITHRFPLGQAGEAYEAQSKAGEAVKVMLVP